MSFEVELWGPGAGRQPHRQCTHAAETWAEMTNLVRAYLAGLAEDPSPEIQDRAEWLDQWCNAWQPEATLRSIVLTLPEHNPAYTINVLRTGNGA